MLLFVRTHNLAREIKGIIERKSNKYKDERKYEDGRKYKEPGRDIDVPIWRGRADDVGFGPGLFEGLNDLRETICS